MRSNPSSTMMSRGCNYKQESSCGREEFALAMAYVPWQHFHNVYEPEKALSSGTIFLELDKPFLPVGRGCRKC